MATGLVLYTIFYFLIVTCFVLPPTEFVNIGFTVEGLFASWLGNEDTNFVNYHIRRTVVTMVVHSTLPFGYVFGLSHFSSIGLANLFIQGSYVWKLIIGVSILIPLIALLRAKMWFHDQWEDHPIARTLALHASPFQTWLAVAMDINVEFRRVDKVCIRTSSVIKIVATDNWIFKVTPYIMHIAHQPDITLGFLNSDSHSISPNNPEGAQFLTIEVKSIRHTTQFQIRMNAQEFQDLRNKVLLPIANIHNFQIQRSLWDRFLEIFKELAEENEVFTTTEELEPCIGCMMNISNVKIRKLCHSTSRREPCQSCFCRPMWCIDCMGRWFASRQDETQPYTWLESQCPCPTCRSRFCMLDVCLVVESR